MFARGGRKAVALLGVCALGLGGLTAAAQSGSAETLPEPTLANSEWTGVYRLNAGGGEFTDSRNLTWKADEHFEGGQARTVRGAIEGTEDDELYQSQRWGVESYDIPIDDGTYAVRLYFAEVESEAGERLMDVRVNGEQALQSLDVATEVGRSRAARRSVITTVDDGRLRINLGSTSGSTAIAAIEVLEPWATSVQRIDAGGESHSDPDGLTWKADDEFLTGGGSVFRTDRTIADAKGHDGAGEGLYRDERWGVEGYRVPVANGDYLVELHFAEINPASGERVFDVTVEDELVVDDLDIAAEVGAYAALTKRAAVRVSDGAVSISFAGEKNEPTVSGIEIFRLRSGFRASSVPGPSSDEGDTRPTTTDAAPTTTARPTSTTTTARPTTTTTRAPARAAAAPTTSGGSSSSGVDMSGWRQVGSDDFSGSSLDMTKWQTYDGTGTAGIGLRKPSAIEVGGGELRIVGRSNIGGGMCWCGRNVDSQQYGRWEFRARMDKGSGFGPAILLWPQSGRWPIDGEIDIYEGGEPSRDHAAFTLHWGADNEMAQHGVDGDFSQWHTWVMEWQPGHIKYWLDGKLMKTFTDPASIPDNPMYLAIQLDPGKDGWWVPGRNAQSPEEITLHVDYVKIYDRA